MPYADPEQAKQCRNESHKRRYADDPEVKAKSLAAAAKWRAANPEKVALNHRRKQLRPSGWTHDAYEAAFAAQDGRCAICGAKPVARPGNTSGRLCADHEHCVPPKPRELICHSCNVALGQLRDNPSIAEAAAAYLRKWGKQ